MTRGLPLSYADEARLRQEEAKDEDYANSDLIYDPELDTWWLEEECA